MWVLQKTTAKLFGTNRNIFAVPIVPMVHFTLHTLLSSTNSLLLTKSNVARSFSRRGPHDRTFPLTETFGSCFFQSHGSRWHESDLTSEISCELSVEFADFGESWWSPSKFGALANPPTHRHAHRLTSKLFFTLSSSRESFAFQPKNVAC